MYFAFNAPHPLTVSHIAEEAEGIRKANPQNQVHVMLLIDCAFDESFLKKSTWGRFPHISLYEGTRLRDFGDAGPLLIALPFANPALADSLTRLAESCGNTPMWSVIVSAIDLEALAQHLRGFLVAECEDRLQWPIRWADTRVLPNLLAMLESSQIYALMEPIYAWLAPTRDGKFHRWNGGGKNITGDSTRGAVPVDAALFDRLVDSAETDAVIMQIFDVQHDILEKRVPFENYRIVSGQLKLASRFAIGAAPARQHFSTLALFLRPEFERLPAFETLLQNVKAGADYSSEVGALPSEFWRDATPKNA